MKKLPALTFATITLSAMMTSYAHAGIKITNESLWYVIPSAVIFMGMMAITNKLTPEHVQFNEINTDNSPSGAVLLRYLTYIPMMAFIGFTAWGIYSAYA